MSNKKLMILLMACASAVSVYAQEAETAGKASARQEIVRDKVLSGTIVDDATGKPLAGMSVTMEGVASAMTDDNGAFTIKLPSYKVNLMVSGPGYQKKYITTHSDKPLSIRLHEAGFSSLFDDVNTPLGIQSGLAVTGALTQFDKDYSTSVATDPDALLSGTVPGLNTISRSGAEGSGANMFLRGFNSIYTNNQPLLIIDGLVVENMAAGVSLIDGYMHTPMGNISVSDIERITVLRDAAVIYGVKGANGAILIETKRSKALETKIDVRALMGINFMPNQLSMLDGPNAKRYLTDVYKSMGYSGTQISDMPIFNQTLPVSQPWGYEGNVDYYRYNHNTNWQDQMFQGGLKSNYSLNISGGDEIAVYNISLGYLHNDGVVKGTDLDRFSARLNTDITFTNALKIQTNMSFYYGTKSLAQEGSTSPMNPIYASLVKAPFTAANVYDAQGKMSPLLEDVDYFGNANPAVVLGDMKQENLSYGFIGGANVIYQFNKNWTASTIFGLRFNKERERIFHPSLGIPYGELPAAPIVNELQHRVERIFTFSDETRINFLKKWSSGHQIDATAGVRYMSTSAEDDWGKGYNSANDYFTSLQFGLTDLRQTGGSLGEWKWLAGYFNGAYAFKDKYFLTATVSVDGSSRYGEDIAAAQIFPSLSAAWLISSEEGMGMAESAFDLLKLRAGFTMSGNDDIGNYTARRYYTSQNILGAYGLVRGNLVNTALKPERVSKFNIGLDMAVFNERWAISFDVYRSKTTNMIAYSNITPLAGYASYVDNNGDMQNTGFDLSSNIRLVNSKALKWDLGVTLSHYVNKVTALNGDRYLTQIADGTILTEVGKPLNVFYGYKTQGVFKTTEAAQRADLYYHSGLQDLPFRAGDVHFLDNNPDHFIDEKDMVVIGDPNPDFYGGFNTSLKFGNFGVSAQFAYSVGNDIYNYTRRVLESMDGLNNQLSSVMNRWVVEGQDTALPKAAYGDPLQNNRFSDRWIEDGSYLKWKNLTITYDVPLRSKFFQGLQVYAVGENLMTLTGYKGYDPEFSVSTNPLGYGIDAFITPRARTFYVGVKVGI